MPRNSSGDYSLPAGNPVVTGTVISSTWANTTMEDLGDALTDSLSRSGDGGMLASFLLVSGAVGAPGLSWSVETTSGLYRAGAGDFRYSVSGSDRFQISSTDVSSFVRFSVSNATPSMSFIESGAAADESRWRILTDAGVWTLQTRTDVDGSGANAIVIDRTGTAVTTISIVGTVLTLQSTSAVCSIGGSTLPSASNLGVDVPVVTLSSSNPSYYLNDTDSPADEKVWRINAVGGDLLFSTRTDVNGSGATYLSITRTGTVVDGIAFSATAITFNGVAVTDFARLGQNNTFTQAGGNLAWPITLSNSQPGIAFGESDAAVDNRWWRVFAISEQLRFDVVNDAASISASWLTVDRTGAVVDSITLNANAAAGTIAFTTNGATNFSVDATRVRPVLPVYLSDGAVGTPSLTFNSDTNTGLYWIGADQIGLTTGGTLRLTVSTGAFTFTLPHLSSDGSAGNPAYSFSGDPDTGFYRSATNAASFTSGGSQTIGFGNGIFLHDGSVTTPAYNFLNDTNTGFFRDTADQIAIALGGVNGGQIAQGSFTITYTGFTANPTGTATWYRSGKIVTLILPALTGTSNATTFTMTGIPAAISPVTTQRIQLPLFAVRNNGSDGANGSLSVAAGGTFSVFESGSGVGWSNINGKGIVAICTVCYSVD